MSKLFITTPREYRFIKALLEHGLVSRRDMDGISGAANSPEIKRNLVERGWPILCKRFDLIDRDGRLCRPGYYYLDDSVVIEAVEVVEEWDAATSHSKLESCQTKPSGD